MLDLRPTIAASLLLGLMAAGPPHAAEPDNSAHAARTQPSSSLARGGAQRGIASYYARRLQGRRTASGEHYDSDKLTAAHRILPLGTMVRVTNVATGKAVVVEVNDRGPHVAGRTIDLSRRAGDELGLAESGLARVTIEVLSPPAG